VAGASSSSRALKDKDESAIAATVVDSTSGLAAGFSPGNHPSRDLEFSNPTVQRLLKIGNLLVDHPAHFESGAFEDDRIFSAIWTNNILQRATSLGLNEQELALLEFVLENGISQLAQAQKGVDSKPELDETLVTLQKVLMRFILMKANVSRIHVHTLHHHMVCYDPLFWGRGDFSIR